MEKTKQTVIERIKAWAKARSTARRVHLHQVRQAALSKASKSRVQAREFRGEIYLCLDDVPLLPVDALKWDLPTAVAVAREAWMQYKDEPLIH